MSKLEFRISGVSAGALRRYRRSLGAAQAQTTGVATVTSPAAVAGVAAAVVLAAYAIIPGASIRITEPPEHFVTNDRVIEVAGTVDRNDIETITLLVNDIPRQVTVENASFRSKVPLVAGRNRIYAAVARAASNPVEVMANVTRADVWIELTWEGPGDVDLHLHLPNDEHCWYRQKKTPVGAELDIDNRRRDGPEHITLVRAPPGKYRAEVVYYSSAQEAPLRWSATVQLKGGSSERRYSDVLRSAGQTQTIAQFEFP